MSRKFGCRMVRTARITNRHEVEEVEEKSRVSQGAEHRVARRQVNQLANASAGTSEQRTANADLRFDPGISRRFFKGDDGSQEWNEYRRAHLQSEPFGRQQMSTFMYEYQQHKPKRKPGAPNHRIHPNCQNHRPARLENHRKEFQHRQDDEL